MTSKIEKRPQFYSSSSMEKLAISRAGTSSQHVALHLYDLDGNEFIILFGITSKELHVDSIINGEYNRNTLI